MDECLTTGQMIDLLQVGETAASDDNTIKTHVIRNELGFYWSFQNSSQDDRERRAWRILTMDDKTVKLKWKIINKID